MLYPALESQIKHVPPDVVSSKWVNLSNTSQEQVRRLLRAVQRPVVARYRDDSKRAEAQLAIHSFIETLERKLPRFPFPPNTKDAHFDYEKLLDSNVSRHTFWTENNPIFTKLELALFRGSAYTGYTFHWLTERGYSKGGSFARC